MLYMNEVTDYSTSAPDGMYLAISRVHSEVTGKELVSEFPVVVFKGKVFPTLLERAAKSLVESHPYHCFLEEIEWDGEDGFLLDFGS